MSESDKLLTDEGREYIIHISTQIYDKRSVQILASTEEYHSQLKSKSDKEILSEFMLHQQYVGVKDSSTRRASYERRRKQKLKGCKWLLPKGWLLIDEDSSFSFTSKIAEPSRKNILYSDGSIKTIKMTYEEFMAETNNNTDANSPVPVAWSPVKQLELKGKR